MKTNFFTSTLLGILALFIVSTLIALSSGTNWNASHLPWMLLSNAMIVLVTGLLITNNTQRGWKLALTVFMITFIIGHFNILIEAYIFNVTDRSQTIGMIMQNLVLTLITSPLLVFIFGKWQGSGTKLLLKSRSSLQWIWRIVLGDLLYLFLYLLAGFVLYTVYPQLMDFYGDKVPPFALMINTQFFRALLFIGIAYLINITTDLSLFKRALLVGAVFSIFGGIAPLIIPGDEFMPAFIRFGHAFEVGISNTLYGIILTYLIGQKIIGKEEIITIKKNKLSDKISS